MLYGEKSLEDAREYLNKKRIKFGKDERKQICKKCFDKYNIPLDATADMLMGKRDPKEYSPLELFAFMSVMNPYQLESYYTPEEIKIFSESKLETVRAELPYEFTDVVQVTDNQWIGHIDVKELMRLRDSQMINYRENSQRILRRVISGGVETLKIFVNRMAVNAIAEAMKKGSYIPDDITLNMLMGESGFYYDKKTHTLTVTELPDGKFDILDGYHRYLAMSQVYNFNSDFNYPMEVRIVNFPIETAQQFIYQKDQKTKMKKIDSQSFNQFSAANRIVSLLNNDSNCLLQGMIGRNGEPINSPVLARLITNFIIPKGLKGAEENRYIITAKSDLLAKINKLVENNPDLLNKPWDDQMLYAMIYAASRVSISLNDYPTVVNWLYNAAIKLDKKLFIRSRNTISKRVTNEFDSVMERWDQKCITQKEKKLF